MYWTKQTLLEHLPMLYRQRDAEIAAREGLEEGPLAALMGVLAEQITAVEGNIDQLYANWFVETCEPWILPYLGKLLGIDRLPPQSSSVYTARAYIANMMSYRRRKGTPGMLEQLARDSTGWYAHVVEYFLLLAQTQHLNRYRPGEWMTPVLRDLETLEKLPGPFTTTNRLPNVRNIDGPLPGLFNIPNIGMHLWPLKAFAPPDATGTPTIPFARFAIEARPETFPASEGEPIARWYLHPLGWTFRMFNRPLSRDPASGATVTALAGERDVPDPLRRLPIHQELEALRQSVADGIAPPALHYLGSQRPVFQLIADDELAPIPPQEIRIVDFSHGWPQPDATESYTPSAGGASIDLPIRVAIDPVRGQVAFAPGAEPSRLRAIYAYGFTMDMGGGPYNRSSGSSHQPAEEIQWQIGVSRLAAPVADEIVSSLTEAIDLWNAQPEGTRGRICILDSMRYDEELTGPSRIRIPEGSQLTLIAADWPQQETDPGIFERLPGTFSPDWLRPHLRGDLEVEGIAPVTTENPGSFHLEGILLEGGLFILPGHLGQLSIEHCTLPQTLSQGLQIQATATSRNSELKVYVSKSILSRIDVIADMEILSIEDSLVGHAGEPGEPAITAPDDALVLQRSTIWGTVTARQVEISECILMGILQSERTQVGCVRYSYLTPGSQAPRQFRCQPSLAITEAGAENNPVMAAQIQLRMQPIFSSLDPSNANFARLAQIAASGIREGGENEREMGVFASMDEPARRRFLHDSIDEFLRAGMAAGIQFVTTEKSINYGHDQMALT